MSTTEDFLTVEGAAEFMKMSERFIRRLIAERRVRFYRVGRSIRFDPADLRLFVRSGCVEPFDRSEVRRLARGAA